MRSVCEVCKDLGDQCKNTRIRISDMDLVPLSSGQASSSRTTDAQLPLEVDFEIQNNYHQMNEFDYNLPNDDGEELTSLLINELEKCIP
jgi:hypothetical protein